MVDTQARPSDDKAEREEQKKSRGRAEQASIVMGLQQVLDGDERLLAFTRGRISGGWRGKLNVGPEAFFAPHVNIGLTDRRFVLQHIHCEQGSPTGLQPHFFPLSEIASLTFADIEMFGKDLEGRLTLRLQNEQFFRLRVSGTHTVEDAQAMVEVFRSLTVAHRTRATPTQNICSHCQHILDQQSKFCPYCGGRLEEPVEAAADTSAPAADAPPESPQPPVPPIFPEPPSPNPPPSFGVPPGEMPDQPPPFFGVPPGEMPEPPIVETTFAAPESPVTAVETTEHAPEPETPTPPGWTHLGGTSASPSSTPPQGEYEAQSGNVTPDETRPGENPPAPEDPSQGEY